jgi:hypothetical protein
MCGLLPRLRKSESSVSPNRIKASGCDPEAVSRPGRQTPPPRVCPHRKPMAHLPCLGRCTHAFVGIVSRLGISLQAPSRTVEKLDAIQRILTPVPTHMESARTNRFCWMRTLSGQDCVIFRNRGSGNLVPNHQRVSTSSYHLPEQPRCISVAGFCIQAFWRSSRLPQNDCPSAGGVQTPLRICFRYGNCFCRHRRPRQRIRSAGESVRPAGKSNGVSKHHPADGPVAFGPAFCRPAASHGPQCPPGLKLMGSQPAWSLSQNLLKSH